MDSVLDCSDDEKRLSKDSDSFGSQSDISSKDIFKNIRTRYLSRVNNVSDPPINGSLIEQSFFRTNNGPEPEGDLDDLPDGFKVQIDNVTTGETNDCESERCASTDYTEDSATNVLSETVLPPFDTKELKRQNAMDLFNEKITRQNAFENVDSTDIADVNLIDLNSVKLISKSESSADDKKTDNIFDSNLSGNYKGKPKSLSMDNLNSNHEYQHALTESTSIEFLGATMNDSELSLYTDGSDCVFISPVEKNNNVIDKLLIKDANTYTDIDSIKDLPVVKAETILPYPYPDDIKSLPKIDFLQPLPIHRHPAPEIDKKIETDLKKVNEELKLTFKAAIERIIGNNRIKRSTTSSRPGSDSSSPISLTGSDITDSIDGSIAKEVLSSFHSKPIDSNTTDNVSKMSNYDQKIENVTSTHVNVPVNTSPIPVIEEVKSTITQERLVDDTVSYRLKINTSDPCHEQETSKVVSINDKNEVNVVRPPRKLKTFLTPINVVNGNVSGTTPIIISPVLIQPILFKPNRTITAIGAPEQKSDKKTVYYDDTDQVITKKSTPIDVVKEESRKKGIYQKNIKTKPLPFLSWMNLGGTNDNLSESKSFSHNKNATSPVNVKNSVSKPIKITELKNSNKIYRSSENISLVTSKTEVTTKPVQVNSKLKDNLRPGTTNPFLQVTLQTTRQSEDNYYEEIGPVSPISQDNNIADDEKISNKTQTFDDFASVTREDILKVPRKPKKPKREDETKSSTSSDEIFVPNKETPIITRSIISLSRTPSANVLKKPTGSIGEMIHNLENNTPTLELRRLKVPLRKFSLQNPKSPGSDTDDGSWPRDKPYWKTQEHKRLSHPLRSLNDPPPPRPLRKLEGLFVTGNSKRASV